MATWVVAMTLLLASGCIVYPEPEPAPRPHPEITVPDGQPPHPAFIELANLRHSDGEFAPGYDRKLFKWRTYDYDDNDCDARNDVLARDMVDVRLKRGDDCKVLRGTLTDPYDGETSELSVRAIDVDHIVSLADAWQRGAASWSPIKRYEFANDPANLLATKSGLNRSKGAQAADEWLPPNTDYHCAFATHQINVKHTYNLSVTISERRALATALESCGPTH